MTTPTSTLLRQLFPSWEFFDVARLPPTLQLRRRSSAGEWGSWVGVVQPSPRRWWHLFFNPAGTQTLAAQTLVERWYTELIELGDSAPASRESLALVTALAETAQADGAWATAAEGHEWQFRLVVLDIDGSTTEIVYESHRLAFVPPPVAR